MGENVPRCREIFKYGFLLQVPNVKWEDVGGLEDVKKSILDTVQVDFLYGLTNDCCFSHDVEMPPFDGSVYCIR